MLDQLRSGDAVIAFPGGSGAAFCSSREGNLPPLAALALVKRAVQRRASAVGQMMSRGRVGCASIFMRDRAYPSGLTWPRRNDVAAMANHASRPSSTTDAPIRGRTGRDLSKVGLQHRGSQLGTSRFIRRAVSAIIHRYLPGFSTSIRSQSTYFGAKSTKGKEWGMKVRIRMYESARSRI